MSQPHGTKRSLSSTNPFPKSPTSQSTRATKKTRFVEPEDDPTTFAEQVDSALEDPSSQRRGKRNVKTEGYDSDSSDDGEGVVFSRRNKGEGEGLGGGGGGGGEDEDEDDMFAAAEKQVTDSANENIEGKKKKEKFMRLGDIEGQEFENDSDEDSEKDDEPEDEDDAERRKKAGMGYELSSFNMREEMEEGKFTEDGSYVRSFDPHGVHDRWMEGLSEKEIKMARRRKKQQERIQRQKQEEEEREIRESGGKESLEQQLLPLIKKGETVLEALQRLGSKSKKDSKPKRKPKAADAMSVDSPPKPKSTTSAPTDIEYITHLASTIMSLGDTDIYSKTYEEILRDVRRSGKVEPNWEPPSADVKFEYKWDVLGTTADTQTFGPFSEEEMQVWFKASYFGSMGEKVKVRTVGGEWQDWDDLLQ